MLSAGFVLKLRVCTNRCDHVITNCRTIHPSWRTTVLSGQHNGEDVTVYAHPGASGYGLVFAIIVVFSLSSPGTVLSSSFLPGYRIPLLAISLLLLVACISPLILIATKLNDAEFFENCAVRQMKEINACSQYSFDLDNVNSTFVECVGLEIASPQVLCLAASTAHASILPQFGLFYTLTLRCVFLLSMDNYTVIVWPK